MIFNNEKVYNKYSYINYVIEYLKTLVQHPEEHCTQFELKSLREKLKGITQEQLDCAFLALRQCCINEIEEYGVCRWQFGYKNSRDYMANAFFKSFIETTGLPIALFPKSLDVLVDYKGALFKWNNETPMEKITMIKSMGYSRPIHGIFKYKVRKSIKKLRYSKKYI